MAVVFFLLFLAAVVGIFKPYISGLKRWHFAITAVVAFFLIGVSAPSQKEEIANAAPSGGTRAEAASSPLAPADETANEGTPSKPPEPESKWEYSTDKDEMRGTVTRFASLQSENEVDLDFPYGTVHGNIWIRRRSEDGLSVAFAVDAGQVLCNSFSNSTVSIKFDDKPIQKFGCTSSSDGSTETAFILKESQALSELRKAKRTVVEAEFFQKGRQQFVFDTIGLKWE